MLYIARDFFYDIFSRDFFFSGLQILEVLSPQASFEIKFPLAALAGNTTPTIV
jgi:hypothetical protein